MTDPLKCACCDETDSKVGFVIVRGLSDKGVFLLRQQRSLHNGDRLRVECADRIGIDVPFSVRYLLRATF
jgi:hypothetical protein